ncbi:MAG TPA: winged helix DNA-binding domain-containing protein [Mycobacteriales bacterium]
MPATWDQVLARRVAAHHLDASAMDGLVPLVRRLCGVHAQLGSAAEAAVWLRTGGTIGPVEVRRALATDRTLVKTWALRGTLHLLPAADLPTWTAALGTRTFARPRSWYDYHGVTPEDVTVLEATVPAVLSGTPMSREQLAAAVVAESGQAHLEAVLRSGWGALLKPMAARGQLAFGPPDGRTVTFVAPRAWVGEWEPVDPERAVGDVVRAALDAYGPLGLEELHRWSALDKPVLRRAVRALGDELVELDVEGSRGWVTVGGAAAVAAAEPSRVVRLLPGFDPYVVGALRQLDRLLPAAGLRSAVSRTSGWISPVLLDGGRIAGTWTQDLDGGRLAVTITPFGPLRGGVREAADAEAVRWAAYADAPLTLTWTPA